MSAQTTTAPNRRAYTLREVYESLGISRETLRRVIDRGDLDAVTVGTRVLVLADDLDAFIAANRRSAVSG